MKEWPWLEKLTGSAPQQINLTDGGQSRLAAQMADDILARIKSPDELDSLESALLTDSHSPPTFILLAVKLAKSKMITEGLNGPLTISLVFAVYKEHNRIARSEDHPHGEDFLRVKVEQMNWLFENTPDINWKILIVDDGCPENSGGIAQSIIEESGLQKRVSVLFLKDGIDEQNSSVGKLESTNQSQKGGAILYGMWEAVRQNAAGNHIVAYTDADLSTHLGQIGLLINPICSGKRAAIGSRRENNSVVIKRATRNNRGKLFIYLWKRLIPQLNSIIDTQCGFKAFDAEIVPEIISDNIEFRFAFDIELLLKTALHEEESIEKVPIAWIDSEAASTTTDLQPYLSMLKTIASFYRRYLPLNATSGQYAGFVDALGQETFNHLLENIPEDITSREPAEFSTYDEVSVSDLIKCFL